MLLGEYHYRVDDKGRVPFPSKFREELKSGLVLARGLDRCIVVYPPSEWAKTVKHLAVPPPSPGKQRRMTRFLFGSAFSSEADAQGRIVLPLPLRQYARIEHDVVIVGVNNCIEVWNEAAWEAETLQASKEMQQADERT